MSHFRRVRVTTTVGELISALSEEAGRFLRSERETNLVVGYIINDLLEKVGRASHRNARQQRRGATRSRRAYEQRS
jgi:hypothetical protein